MKKKSVEADNAPDKCVRCGSACCRYLTVHLTTPRSILDFDNLLWKMFHEQVQIFKDHDGWHLLINNRCTNLQDDGKCGIYEQRPFACREHSVDNCDADNPIEEVADLLFSSPDSLVNYCRKRFKSWESRHRTGI